MSEKVVASSSDTANLNVIDEVNLDVLPTKIQVFKTPDNKQVDIVIQELKSVASGSFGVVYEGLINKQEHIAMKKVLEDKRYKNRELEIMKTLSHNHITTLLYYFYSINKKKDETFLNLIMNFLPQNLTRILRFYMRNNSFLPINYTKLYMYQMIRGLHYLHQVGVCHRDIKPQNILIDPARSLLRICDFGSAKKLISTETNISYICSRYYRAPELIFGATKYSTAIDIWSAGCVFAEVLLNKPIFLGETSVDQMVEIIKVMGTPSREEIIEMNPTYDAFQFPSVNPTDFKQLFKNPGITDQVTSLLKRMLMYSPNSRITALDAILDSWFDQLRQPNFTIEANKSLPPLIDFSTTELHNVPGNKKKKLVGKK